MAGMKVLSDAAIGNLCFTPQTEGLLVGTVDPQTPPLLTREDAQLVVDYVQAWIVLSAPGLGRQEEW